MFSLFFCFFLFHVLILGVSPYVAQVSLDLYSLNLPNAEITGKHY